MLAQDLYKVLCDYYSVRGIDIEDVDITKPFQVKSVLDTIKPHIIINAAAYTKVDDCEINSELADNVNGYGPGYIAEWCVQNKARLIHFSTDYIFDGTKNGDYIETDTPNPVNYYGKSKWLGEQRIVSTMKGYDNYLILRTAWLFGMGGNNFITTILKLAREKPILTIVHDQIGCPTYTYDLAEAVQKALTSSLTGTYHVTNAGHASWADFAEYFLTKTGLKTVVKKVTTSEYPRPAQRPKKSILNCNKFINATRHELRSWQLAVDHYLAMLSNQNR